MMTNGLPSATLDQMFPWKPSTEQTAFVKAHRDGPMDGDKEEIGVHSAYVARNPMTNNISQRRVFAAARTVAAVFAVLLITASLGLGQQAPQLSKEDRHTLETYVLSLDKLNKAIAVQKDINKIVATDPSIENSMKQVSGETLEQQFKRMDSNPKIANALHKAGLVARDWRLTQACAATAYMVAKTKKDGGSPEQMEQVMKMFPWKPSPEQLAFVDEHHAEMGKFMQPAVQDK